MRIIDKDNKEVEINSRHWPLAEALFLKWGSVFTDETVHVQDLSKLTPELSAWGIPWKMTKWD